MNVELYIPLVTAALTLGNTIILWLINRRSLEISKRVNGMQLQLLAEAERRGRRHAVRDPNGPIVED